MEDQRAPAPALLSGDTNSLSFSSELERSNYLRYGIGVGATYDDNANNVATGRIGDFSYSILPSIELDQTRSRLHWTLGYTAGFTANQRLTARNQGSHDLTGTLQYRLSPHVDLRLSDSFLDVTGLLQQYHNGINAPVTGPISQPNPTLITPLAKSINNTAAADISYQYSEGNVIGGGGTFYDAHFRDIPAGTAQLRDTSTRSGNAFFNHRFTARNWTSVTYKYSHIASTPGVNTDVTHSVLLTHTIYLAQHMTLSFFAGPEYSSLDTQTVTMLIAPPVISFAAFSNHENFLSAAGGANFSWQGQLTSVRLGVARQVSDGGGLLGAVVLTNVNGGIRRQLTRSMAVNLNAQYGRNRELGSALAGNTPLQSASGEAGVEQKLGANFLLRLQYDRDYQKGSLATPVGSLNHNRGTVSISYNFTRPMGR